MFVNAAQSRRRVLSQSLRMAFSSWEQSLAITLCINLQVCGFLTLFCAVTPGSDINYVQYHPYITMPREDNDGNTLPHTPGTNGWGIMQQNI